MDKKKILFLVVIVFLVFNLPEGEQEKKEWSLIDLLLNPRLVATKCLKNNGTPDMNWKYSEYNCQDDTDCVPATCCHPSSAVNVSNQPDCNNVTCTETCVPYTMDCNNGEPICIEGKCVAWYKERSGTCTKNGQTCDIIDYNLGDCGFSDQGIQINYEFQGGEWHLISFPLQLENYSVSNVFSDIYGDMMLYGEDGPLDDIDQINPNKAYWLHVNQDNQITLKGQPYQDLSVGDLDKAYNLVGYKSTQISSISDINNIVGSFNYDMVKGATELVVRGANPITGDTDGDNMLVYTNPETTSPDTTQSMVKKTGGSLTSLQPKQGYIVEQTGCVTYSCFKDEKDNWFRDYLTFSGFIYKANQWVDA